MAEKEPPRLHSTLELVRYDTSAGAPECDDALLAPESDRQLEAPQTTPIPGPEIAYSNALPEAITGVEDIPAAGNTGLVKTQPGRPSRKLIYTLSTIGAMIFIAVCVGVGLGVGLQHRKVVSGRNSAATMTVTRTTSTSPTTSRQPPPTVLTGREILNDTSLAAIALANGDRRLFFQDHSGAIRQGYYSASTRTWRSDLSYVVAPNAKNNTPIAAVDDPLEEEDDKFTGLAVIYLSKNNSLAAALFQGGAWHNTTESTTSSFDTSFTSLGATSMPYYASISQFVAASDSRHLSMTVVHTQNGSYALMLYESSIGGLTLLMAH
ncbi:MAG: hypothetical protein Q9225_000946 [Loekoesia sp. 1 TL-2023]